MEITELRSYFEQIRMATLLGSKNVLDTEEAALYTGYAVGTIEQLRFKGDIPCYKRGGRVFYKKTELDAWMTENRVRTRHDALKDYEKKMRTPKN